MSELASSINSNYKTLDRWFKKFVGTTPKKFLQLHRFKNIILQLDNKAEIDWIDLVEDYGFHDQSHFINHFKSIASHTPTAYLQYKNNAPFA